MYRPHWEHTDAVAARAGHGNRSAALRLIVERDRRVGSRVDQYLSALENGVITVGEARDRLHALMDELIVEVNDG
jgi:hypothetical protein